MPRPASTEPRKRLNLDLPMRTGERLERLRVMLEADSLTEVIRRSLEIVELLLETRAAKGKIILRRKDGEEKELVIS